MKLRYWKSLEFGTLRLRLEEGSAASAYRRLTGTTVLRPGDAPALKALGIELEEVAPPEVNR